MTSQPDKAKYCSDAHRIYAWRERRRRNTKLPAGMAAGIALDDKKVTAPAVID